MHIKHMRSSDVAGFYVTTTGMEAELSSACRDLALRGNGMQTQHQNPRLAMRLTDDTAFYPQLFPTPKKRTGYVIVLTSVRHDGPPDKQMCSLNRCDGIMQSASASHVGDRQHRRIAKNNIPFVIQTPNMADAACRPARFHFTPECLNTGLISSLNRAKTRRPQPDKNASVPARVRCLVKSSPCLALITLLLHYYLRHYPALRYCATVGHALHISLRLSVTISSCHLTTPTGSIITRYHTTRELQAAITARTSPAIQPRSVTWHALSAQ